MKFIIYSDSHKYAMHERKYRMNQMNSNVVYLGDNYDLTNCLKKDQDKVRREQMLFREGCLDTGTTFVDGNHDQVLGETRVLIHRIKDVLFTHGHLVCWDAKKIVKWLPENKKAKGRSWWKFHVMRLRNLFKSRGLFKPKQWQLDKMVELCSIHGCKKIVFGHTHTKRVTRGFYKNIEWINVPMGKSVVDIELGER